MQKETHEIIGRIGGDIPRGWEATGLTRDFYADLSEPIVRQAVAWQDKDGRIIDPYVHEETPTATARFVGALGFLIRAGRCLDLVEVCSKSMEIGCLDLYEANRKPLKGAEFYVKELMAGYIALKGRVDGEVLKRWEKHLGGYNPEENYVAVLAKVKAENIHNFCTFAIAGEAFKKKYGLADNEGFIDRHIEIQKRLFTEFGMYRDPHDPMTYDGVPRMNLSLALFAGYRGKHHAFVDEMLREGGLTTLLYMSPTGECPYGGRSNQQNFNEAMIALICEYEASRYQRQGKLELAGAFKRMARLSALSVKRWLEMTPPRFTKNSFPPDSQHGRQKAYGYYGAYSLLIASQFGFAHLLADDTIPEKPAPCEAGGYVFRLKDAFHKVFATCQGHHLEIDTNADFHYDATGLGRFHRTGFPTELGVSCPFVTHPDYLVSRGAAPRNIAIGPGWIDGQGKRRWLADFTGEKDVAEMEVMEKSAGRVRFKLAYPGICSRGRVIEEYQLDGDGLVISNSIENYSGEFFVQIPLLADNGRETPEIKIEKNAFVVRCGGNVFKAECLFPQNTELSLESFEASNRNGVYKVGFFKAPGGKITCRLGVR
ncbi:MAG: hypothetical protein PHV34_14365 [Verrucomicrobiae bacterium]|nr:hypothetical protein [Verrucomicrobiae bacterium]